MVYGSPTSSPPGRVGFTPQTPQQAQVTAINLDDALWKLDQERVRNDSLLQLNRDLRSELDETRKLNSALSSDLTKLSDDWDKLARQLGDRESAWKAEEQAYSDYYANEHAKLLSLWKKVAGLKRDFGEIKNSTGRDLGELRNSLGRLANSVATGVVTATVNTLTPQQVR
jgi:rootletin